MFETNLRAYSFEVVVTGRVLHLQVSVAWVTPVLTTVYIHLKQTVLS